MKRVLRIIANKSAAGGLWDRIVTVTNLSVWFHVRRKNKRKNFIQKNNWITFPVRLEIIILF